MNSGGSEQNGNLGGDPNNILTPTPVSGGQLNNQPAQNFSQEANPFASSNIVSSFATTSNPNFATNPNPVIGTNFTQNYNPTPTSNPIPPHGAGDIIINNAPNKKSRKSLIIALSVLAGIIILILIGVLIWNISRASDNLSVNDYLKQYLSLLDSGKKDNSDSPNELSVLSLSDSENENIYNIPRFLDPLSEKNITYYNELQKTLDKIKDKAQSSNLDENIGSYVDDSKILLSYYFVGTALAYTNASYNYFLKNGNLNDFLSAYWYPFEETQTQGALSDFALAIKNAYSIRAEVYDEISKTKCITDRNIDYECLSKMNSESLNEKQLTDRSFARVLVNYSDSMLIILVADANNIVGLVKEESNEQ